MIRTTSRQLEILFFIAQYIAERQLSPSHRDITYHFDFAIKGAQDVIGYLKRKGLLTNVMGCSHRSFQITPAGRKALAEHGWDGGNIYQRIKLGGN